MATEDCFYDGDKFFRSWLNFEVNPIEIYLEWKVGGIIITLNKDSATGERKITRTYIRSRKKVKAQTFKGLKKNNPSLSEFKED